MQPCAPAGYTISTELCPSCCLCSLDCLALDKACSETGIQHIVALAQYMRACADGKAKANIENGRFLYGRVQYSEENSPSFLSHHCTQLHSVCSSCLRSAGSKGHRMAHRGASCLGAMSCSCTLTSAAQPCPAVCRAEHRHCGPGEPLSQVSTDYNQTSASCCSDGSTGRGSSRSGPPVSSCVAHRLHLNGTSLLQEWQHRIWQCAWQGNRLTPWCPWTTLIHPPSCYRAGCAGRGSAHGGAWQSPGGCPI